MRNLLRYTSASCDFDEKRVNIYINGTRVAGCVHSDAEHKKNIALIIGLVVALVVLIICVLYCYCRLSHTCKFPSCISNKMEEHENKKNDEYVRTRLGAHIEDFLQGKITPAIRFIISQARREDGPLTNNEFESYFRRNMNVQVSSSVDKICFEIRNIQP